MKTKTLTMFAILCTLAAPTSVFAGGAARPQSSNPPELARLRALVGQWKVVETFGSGKSGARKGAGKLEARLGPGGKSVIMTYRSTAGPMKGFELHEILSWDPKASAYQMVFVTSFQPGVTVATGRVEGTDIVFPRKERRGGAVVHTKSVLSELEDGRFTLTSYVAKKDRPPKRTLMLECRKR